MNTLTTVSRKQRLQTLENQIRTAATEIQKNGIQIGRDLCEIRDEELWTDDYPSWNQYLKDQEDKLVGKSFAQAAALIRSAEISKRIPASMINHTKDLGATHFQELGRLAPDDPNSRGTTKDYSRLRKQDVARVLKKAKEIAGDKEPTVREIRKAVDHDLGIDRVERAKATKKEREERDKEREERDAYVPPVENYLWSESRKLDAVIKHLSQMTSDQ